MDPRIEAVKSDLADIGVDADFSNACLRPLQEIRRRVTTETLTGQIANLVQEAEDAEDDAHRQIEMAVKAAQPKTSTEPTPASGIVSEKPAKPPVPTTRVSTPQNFRQRRQVVARQVTKTPYLESTEEVEAYLAALRKQLEEALAQNARIEIV
ncbi:MAG: hypothetical protein EON96_10170 [Caulobacteraceae bacterium]|nr:MAG: hypothetical protein EON96_10170 [Caulobacteraceae bacterium]